MLADVVRRAAGGAKLELPDGAAAGDELGGGYFVGIIDTTQGNIIPEDASQTGERYALIVAPRSLETVLRWKTTATAAPAAARTRWDGLSATLATGGGSVYPAATYCLNLAHDADGASEWYLPALDELELVYRYLKATTDKNDTSYASVDFPPSRLYFGENPSSDPPGAPYAAYDPTQTTVPAFRSGGGQHLGVTGESRYYWTSTETTVEAAAIQRMSGGGFGAGSIGTGGEKNGTYPLRPVRRLVL